MMLQSSRLGFPPFPDVLGGFVANLYTATAVHHIHGGGQFVGGLGDVGTEAKSTDLDAADFDRLEWQLWWLDYLLDAASNVRAGDLVLVLPSEPRQRKPASSKRRPVQLGRAGSVRRLAAGGEQLLTYAVVVATLLLFLHLTRANAAALLLPTLSRATGCSALAAAQAGGAVLALVNAAGVLGSALATRRYGREATSAVSAALIGFCQVGVPAIVGPHAGLGSGTSTTAAACHSAATFVVSCGLGWAWGALFWAAPGPGEGIRSAGPAALGFAQMHFSLLTLRRLRHATLAYYAARIWS